MIRLRLASLAELVRTLHGRTRQAHGSWLVGSGDGFPGLALHLFCSRTGYLVGRIDCPDTGAPQVFLADGQPPNHEGALAEHVDAATELRPRRGGRSPRERHRLPRRRGAPVTRQPQLQLLVENGQMPRMLLAAPAADGASAFAGQVSAPVPARGGGLAAS